MSPLIAQYKIQCSCLPSPLTMVYKALHELVQSYYSDFTSYHSSFGVPVTMASWKLFKSTKTYFLSWAFSFAFPYS